MTRDIVCFVKHSDVNEELRYAIRSWVENLPHRNIVLVGYKPNFIKGVTYIPVQQREWKKEPSGKFYNTTAQLMRACESDQVSDDFYLMNDDFFVMKPVDEVPLYHWKTVGEVLKAKWANGTARDPYYMHMMAQMPQEWNSYALHLPMPINKRKWLECYEAYNHLPYFHANRRTFYGNLVGGSEPHDDVKIYGTRTQDFTKYTYLSTETKGFAQGSVGKYVRMRFPNPTKYEKI